MANIKECLQKILSARYGKDVRNSIHDALFEMNEQIDYSETSAKNSAVVAAESEKRALVSESNANEHAIKAQSYAVGGTGTRENEDIENAKFYYEQAERIAKGLSGTLLPCGTIAFEELANVQALPGYMYNISNKFTSDDRFIHSGIEHGVGANIYMTIEGKWDVLAGSNVISVNGKTGVVILKAADIKCEDGTTVEKKLSDLNTNFTKINSDLLKRTNVGMISLAKGVSKKISLHTAYDTLLISTTTTANTGQSGLCGFYVVHGRRSDLAPLVTSIAQASNISITQDINSIIITNNSDSFACVVNIHSADSVIVE